MRRPGSSHAIRVAVIAIAAAIAWPGAARSDDALDRRVDYHVAASTLATALIEFASQSGVQIAAADADVADRRSGGLAGNHSIRGGLSLLLDGSNLTFSQVGAQTVAIRAVPIGPAIGTLTRAAPRGTAPTPPTATQLSAPAATAAALPDVTVATPRPPTAQELAGDSLYQFIVHHATVHYFNTGTTGNLARWRGGRSGTICPSTVGLDEATNRYVTARLRALALNVGAPLQADPHCKDNVRILFTPFPDEAMADVVRWAKSFFGIRFGQMQRLMLYRGDHAVQGWYITTPRASNTLNTDFNLLAGMDVWPLWPQVTPQGLTDDRLSGIVSAILIVDTTKVAGEPIGPVADYLAELAMTVAQSPDHCDSLPSILDLMAPSCAARGRPTSITAGDLAFLKALYYRKSSLGASLTRDEIKDNIERQFASH